MVVDFMTTCLKSSLHFTLNCRPVAQGRPRATIIGGHPHLYDPESSRTYKNYIRSEIITQMCKSKTKLSASCINMPVSVDLVFYMPVPSRWNKAQKALADDDKLPHLVKPDCDNLAKAVLDACTGVLWHDDNQVFSLQAKKFYSRNPRVDMSIEYFDFAV